MTEKEFNTKLKDAIRLNPFFVVLFKKFHVPVERMYTNLTFKVGEIDGKNAISDAETITFNKKLLKSNFFEEGLHYVVHEMVHWLQRQREGNMYFSDPEEIEAFSTGIAYELGRGKKEEDIRAIYYPIIVDHFNNPTDAEKMFCSLVFDAKKRLKDFK